MTRLPTAHGLRAVQMHLITKGLPLGIFVTQISGKGQAKRADLNTLLETSPDKVVLNAGFVSADRHELVAFLSVQNDAGTYTLSYKGTQVESFFAQNPEQKKVVEHLVCLVPKTPGKLRVVLSRLLPNFVQKWFRKSSTSKGSTRGK